MHPQVDFHCRQRKPFRHGLSQVEVVASTLIVGVILVGALNVLGGATQNQPCRLPTSSTPLAWLIS